MRDELRIWILPGLTKLIEEQEEAEDVGRTSSEPAPEVFGELCQRPQQRSSQNQFLEGFVFL